MPFHSSLDPVDSAPEVPRGTIDSILRNWRKVQQGAILGPVLGIQRAAQEGRVVSPRDVLSGSREALARDLSFRDAAERAGLEGKTAWAVGTLGDLLLDPFNLVPGGALVKGGRAALQAARVPQATRAIGRAGQRAIEAVPGGGAALEKAKRGFITDYGKPAEYVEVFDQFGRNRAARIEQAADLGKRLDEFSPADQRIITQYLESPLPPGVARESILMKASAGQGTVNKAGDNIVDLSKAVRQADIDIGKQLVDEKLIDKEVMDRLGGSHVKHMYREIEKNPALLGSEKGAPLRMDLGFGAPRERTGILTKRKGAPQDWSRIQEAAYPVAKGQSEAGTLLATREFFNEVVERGFAQDAPADGYKLISDNKIYGPLAKKYVPEAIYDDIVQAGGGGSKGFKNWKKGVGLWKYGKIVMNPASHARNIIGNFVLADMAGLSPWKIHRFRDGARSLATKDEYYALAKKHSDFLTDTFAKSELPAVLDTATELPQLEKGVTQWLKTGVKKGLRAHGKLYQAEEEFFKQSFFIDHMKNALARQGKTLDELAESAKTKLAKDAGKAADEALFNYRKLPMAIDRARRFGVVPFIAFPWKAAPATVKAMGNRPEVFTRYGNLMRAFEPEVDQQASERRAVPEWMQSNWMRLPENTPFVKNKSGDPVFLNMEYILPWTEVGEIVDRTAQGQLDQGFLGTSGPQLSYLNVPAANLVAAFMLGRDTFTGRPIEEYQGGRTQYFLDQLLPNAPQLGIGRGARELRASRRGEHVDPARKDFTEEPRSFGSAVLKNFFGLSTQPVNLLRSHLRGLRALGREADGISREAAKTWELPDTTPRELQKKERALKKHMDELREVMRRTFFLTQGRWPDDAPPE
jgi:hypothetical protein